MQYAGFEFSGVELPTTNSGIDSNLLQYVDGISSTVEDLTNIWPYFETWPWTDTIGGNIDNALQFSSRQPRSGGTGSDSGSSSRSNSQALPTPRESGLTRKESRRQRRLEQNHAAQRAFRERKEKALVELQDQIRILKDEAGELITENEQLQSALTEAQKTIEVLKSVVPSTDDSASKIVPYVKPSGKPNGPSRSFLVKIDIPGFICACGLTQSEPALSLAQIGCHGAGAISLEHDTN